MACCGVRSDGDYKHKRDCVSTMVIPVTEWESDGNSKILGYECPKCGVITLVNGKIWIPMVIE